MAKAESTSEFFHPKLQTVEAMAPYRLRTTWSTGEVLDVDVELALRSTPALAGSLRPEVFAKAHLAEWGQGIEWFDAELGADNVYVRRCTPRGRVQRPSNQSANSATVSTGT